MFLDSDDTLGPDKLNVNIEYIHKFGKNKCYYSGFRFVDNGSEKVIEMINPSPIKNILN